MNDSNMLAPFKLPERVGWVGRERIGERESGGRLVRERVGGVGEREGGRVGGWRRVEEGGRSGGMHGAKEQW
jgi:hypothetical protein